MRRKKLDGFHIIIEGEKVWPVLSQDDQGRVKCPFCCNTHIHSVRLWS